MARKVPKKDQIEDRSSVEAIAFESALVVTIEEDDPIWEESTVLVRIEWAGSFVRLRPPPRTSDEGIEVIRNLVAETARAVRVIPRRRVAIVPMRIEKRANMRLRDVVMGIAGKANARDRAALDELLVSAMNEAGL